MNQLSQWDSTRNQTIGLSCILYLLAGRKHVVIATDFWTTKKSLVFLSTFAAHLAPPGLGHFLRHLGTRRRTEELLPTAEGSFIWHRASVWPALLSFAQRCFFVVPFSWENGEEDCHGRKPWYDAENDSVRVTWSPDSMVTWWHSISVADRRIAQPTLKHCAIWRC